MVEAREATEGKPSRELLKTPADCGPYRVKAVQGLGYRPSHLDKP